MLQTNIDRNKALVKKSISVLELNFFKTDFNAELLKLLPDVRIILAADGNYTKYIIPPPSLPPRFIFFVLVIYDNDITVAFVKTMQALLKLSPNCNVYVALEKRYVFLLSECDTYAPCYEFFLECVQRCPDIVSEQLLVDFPQYFLYERVKELVLWKFTLKM